MEDAIIVFKRKQNKKMRGCHQIQITTIMIDSKHLQHMTKKKKKGSEVSVSTCVISNTISNINKRKTIKNMKVRYEEEDEKESVW